MYHVSGFPNTVRNVRFSYILVLGEETYPYISTVGFQTVSTLERSLRCKIDMNSLDICVILKSVFASKVNTIQSKGAEYPSSRPIPDCLNPPKGI